MYEPVSANWTRAALERFEATELWADLKFELIEGNIYDQRGRPPQHYHARHAIAWWLIDRFGFAFVRRNSPIEPAPQDAQTSRPEPSLALLTVPWRTFYDRHPSPTEIRFLIDVEPFPQNEIYARAGIQEYWTWSSAEQELTIHRGPINGIYTEVPLVNEASPLCAPDYSFSWSNLQELFTSAAPKSLV